MTNVPMHIQPCEYVDDYELKFKSIIQIIKNPFKSWKEKKYTPKVLLVDGMYLVSPRTYSLIRAKND